MKIFIILVKKELKLFFISLSGYLFLILWLMSQSFFTFYLGDFLRQDQADLILFFSYIPWVYLFFIPALTMGSWFKEKKHGTLETLITLPIHYRTLILAKFFSNWLIVLFFLLGTFPIWMTVNYLGNPDNSVISLGYCACFLLGGIYIGIGLFFSFLMKNEGLSYLFTLITLFFLLTNDIGLFNHAIIPNSINHFIASVNLLTFFNHMIKGVIYLCDVIFLFSFILFLFWVNLVIFEQRTEN